MRDSSDDDYELPSLSDRVQAFQKQKNVSEVYLTSDSECDEKEFLKFSEKIRSTPCSTIKTNLGSVCGRNSEVEDLEVSKENHESPFIPRVQSLKITADDESDESDFLNFSERVWKTPQSNINLKITSDSESDESDFLKFSEKVWKTPRSNIKDNFRKNSAYKQSNIPVSAHKPQSIKKPLIKNKEICCKASASDSDDSFSTPKILPKTAKPPIRTIKKMSSSPTVLKEQNSISKQANEPSALPNSGHLSVPQIENEKEFKALFPPSTVDSSFIKDRALSSRKLYDFFNKKIFKSELPGDMHLQWDGSLLVTAGLTCCSRKNGIYSCYIKLSSKLLTSFERMQDTLLHEMCHAAVWLIGHRNEHHGPLWKIWASRCKLILPCVDVPERCHTYDIDYRVWYKCPSCKKKIGRCKQVRKFQNAVCGRCNVPLVVSTN